MDPPRSSLCPGYKHVASFSPSLSSPKSKNIPLTDHGMNASPSANEHAPEENVDYEEEVEYIVLDLGNIEPTLVPSSSTYRLIGLDTPTPFLQLSGTVLMGRHDNLLGSELVFTDDKDSSSTLSGQKKRGVTHVSTTSKRIAFKEVQLRPKEKTSAPVPGQTFTHTEESIGLEEVHLEDADDTMDIDDALEYADINIDPVLQEPQPQAGPSRLTRPSIPQEASILASILSSRSSSPSAFDSATALTSFSSFISITAGEDRLPDNPSSITSTEEVSSDPALRIDRLTGTSPLTRAPRGSKKTVSRSSIAASSGTGLKTTAKGKQKQKAKADTSADGSGMDTNEG